MVTIPLVPLSEVVKRPLLDGDGNDIGQVADVVARMGGRAYPPIVGIVARIGGLDVFVPIHELDGLGADETHFQGEREGLRPFERRPQELLLARDLLARHLINVVGGHLVRAHEIELANLAGTWHVVGIDPTARSPLRRLISWRKPSETGKRIVDWASIEPFVSHVPTARLRIPYRQLSRLRPAQIADLVEAASHEEGEEIIQAVSVNRELEADVFEELEPEHQVEFIESRSDAEAARILGKMAPDDAVDLIMEIEQDRRLPVLNLLPEPQQQKVRSLLSYNPETAGGMMSPDFVCLPAASSVSEVLGAIRSSPAPSEALYWVFSTDEGGNVSGAASLVSLVRSRADASLGSVSQPDPVHVHADWDLNATLRKMSDYNLTVVPVLDEDHRTLLGVVTVDDLLELLLPSGWRRDHGVAAADDEDHAR